MKKKYEWGCRFIKPKFYSGEPWFKVQFLVQTRERYGSALVDIDLTVGKFTLFALQVTSYSIVFEVLGFGIDVEFGRIGQGRVEDK